MTKLSILDQIKTAACNPLAVALSLIPGFIPFVIFTIAHDELPVETEMWRIVGMWAIIVGGCAFSFKSVFQWLRVFCQGDALKGAGATVLIELAMTIPHDTALTHTALGLPMGINVVASACSLAMEDARKKVRSAAAKRAAKTRREAVEA